jgi:hypothetical protein
MMTGEPILRCTRPVRRRALESSLPSTFMGIRRIANPHASLQVGRAAQLSGKTKWVWAYSFPTNGFRSIARAMAA